MKPLATLLIIIAAVHATPIHENHAENVIQTGRVINGNDDTTVNYVVRIVASVGTDTRGSLSTGVLISPQRIVTVAQVIQGFNQWTIQHGTGPISSLVIQRTTDAVAHPLFNPANFSNNIGIINVNFPIVTNYPRINSTFVPGLLLLSFGYGITATSNPANILQRTDFIALSKEPCIDEYTETFIFEHSNCARNLGTGKLAGGDQGAPVVSFTDRNELYGIVSFWNDDVEQPTPSTSVFVHVYDFIDFISGA